MNKKYLYLFIATIAFFMLFLGFILFQQNDKSTDSQVTNTSTNQTSDQPQANQNNQNTNNNSTTTNSTTSQVNTVKPTLGLMSPEDMTYAFYMDYLLSPNNPLANGQYKNSQYLSRRFKEIVGSIYDEGNKTVFCQENRRKSVIVGKTQSVYNKEYGYLKQVIISDAASGQDLYRVNLNEEDGRWLILDINCIY